MVPGKETKQNKLNKSSDLTNEPIRLNGCMTKVINQNSHWSVNSSRFGFIWEGKLQSGWMAELKTQLNVTSC